MKAWVITKYGGPETLKFQEMEKPILSKGKILIEIHYASLNPYDYKLRNGIAKLMTGSKFPKVFGGDFAGKVVEASDKVNFFKPGQMVYGFANIFMREQGSLAEFTCISPKYVRPLPTEIAPESACTITSAGLTALNGIRKCGNLENKNILVNGATGGVGHIATLIFKAKGAKVTAVCSSKNVELARKLGAERVIDYTKENVLNPEDKYDVIFDAAAKLSFSSVKNNLSVGGIFCTTEESLKAMLAILNSKFHVGKKMALSGFRGTKEEFEELESLMRNYSLNPVIENEYSFADVDKAFQMLETGKPAGKILIKVKE